MSTKTITIRTMIDPEAKKETEAILKPLGLTVSEAIRLFLNQIRQEKALPFEMRIPTPETRQALTEAQDKNKLAAFATPEELFQDLGLA
jgi:DNA-damage-inducible protein J